MRRLLLVALAVGGLATAGAHAIVVQTGGYNGQIKGDPYPGSSISFKVKRTAAGKRRIVKFIASGMAYTCKGGMSGSTPAVSLERGFRVRKDRTFGGRADAVILGFDPPARLKGKLRRRGRAVGTLRVFGELDPVGQPGVYCDTGLQEWRAKKGPRQIVLP